MQIYLNLRSNSNPGRTCSCTRDQNKHEISWYITRLTKIFICSFAHQRTINTLPSADCSDIALNKHLYRSSLRTVSTRFECADRILEAEPMSNQPLHVQDPTLHQADCSWPGVGIAVLELKIDFLGAQAHKGELHLWLADTNDEDFAAKFDGVYLKRTGQHQTKLRCSSITTTVKDTGN